MNKNSMPSVALKALTTKSWKVATTKFDRVIGDVMVIDGKSFEVIHVGTWSQCIAHVNETVIDPLSAETRKRNAEIRRTYKASPVLQIIHDLKRKYPY